MKIALLLFLSFFLLNHCFSQIENLNGVWINNFDNKGLVIKNGKSIFMEGTEKTIHRFEDLIILKDTLKWIIKKSIYPYGQTEGIDVVESYDFKIINLTEKTLKVKPSSSVAKSYFGGNIPRTYTKQDYISSDSIKFEKLIYNTDRFSLEIDSVKSIKLIDRSDRERKFYSGTLSDIKYEELINLIKISKINNLKLDYDGGWSHIPHKTYIIYLNGVRKKFNFQMIPIVMQALNNFVIDLYKNHNLLESTEKYEFEKW